MELEKILKISAPIEEVCKAGGKAHVEWNGQMHAFCPYMHNNMTATLSCTEIGEHNKYFTFCKCNSTPTKIIWSKYEIKDVIRKFY